MQPLADAQDLQLPATLSLFSLRIMARRIPHVPLPSSRPGHACVCPMGRVLAGTPGPSRPAARKLAVSACLHTSALLTTASRIFYGTSPPFLPQPASTNSSFVDAGCIDAVKCASDGG